MAKGKVPLLAGDGFGHRTCHRTRDRGQRSRDGRARRDRPYYLKPSQAEIIEHFRQIKAEVGLPIVAYDIPVKPNSRPKRSCNSSMKERHGDRAQGSMKAASGAC
ncbi:MAG: dihydrodipicolinate synthase family protein [Thermomicrobiales bacterium]